MFGACGIADLVGLAGSATCAACATGALTCSSSGEDQALSCGKSSDGLTSYYFNINTCVTTCPTYTYSDISESRFDPFGVTSLKSRKSIFHMFFMLDRSCYLLRTQPWRRSLLRRRGRRQLLSQLRDKDLRYIVP